ncbi:carbamoyltransferase HypF [Phosphitispora sp. TUW77]|uniref:carbamoyltransferase HypF n=1 Tax=Phosphitispora sp. TUW77 TaxID=3152361 RepID=UPI003AB1800A
MTDLKRYSVHISGIVQGVGMRPYIYKTAKRFNIRGWVSNQGTSVVMKIMGSKKSIEQFLENLLNEPPPGANICSIEFKTEQYTEQFRSEQDVDYNSFSIISSSANGCLQGFIPPDTGICDECINEIRDKRNRRYEYAFTNCTHCGPRYSIIRSLPYDRLNTAMAPFKMCPVCRNEYESPESRRFHSQTNCCPDCGPRLFLFDSSGKKIESIHPINAARELLHQGKLGAIKGTGGYHLVCNALNEKAVTLMRQRKRRPYRPLALMAASIDAVKLICRVNSKEEELLTGTQRPIVLLEKNESSILPYSIAPRINRFGVMLPYTPLHYLLFDEKLRYLVMTSGNSSGLPICYKDNEAMEKLKNIADFFLVHNREILTPVDDSVVRVVAEREMVSRCGRGYAPAALRIKAGTEVIALGAQEKASVCLLHKEHAHMSQYLGSLEDMDSCNEYLRVINLMKILLDSKPKFIAHDLHPGYFSTQYAAQEAGTKLPVQHHHAHMAACMAEHGLTKDTIGVIYDGTGMGTDGAIWGGEFFVGSMTGFIRSGHWKYVTLQGGDSMIKEPWKCAASYLYAMGLDSADFFKDIDVTKIKAVQDAVRHNINCFNSSSMGRLFDCVSALVIKRMRITYDAQAAIELESVVNKNISDYYPYSICEKENKLEIGYEEIILGILEELKARRSASYVSAKFHNTICKVTVDCICKMRLRYRINDVVLSGGVFENSYLLTAILKELKNHDFNVYCSMRVPANDGGLSFGQAAIAAHMKKEDTCVFGSSGKDYVHT